MKLFIFFSSCQLSFCLQAIIHLFTFGAVNPVIPFSNMKPRIRFSSSCYPIAIPFLTETNVFLSKIARIPVIERKLHLNPIVPMPNGNDPYMSIPTKKVFELGRIWTNNLHNTELPHTLPPIPTQVHSAKRVHWSDEPSVLLIEPNGRMTPTTYFTIQEKKVRQSDRQQKTGRSRY